MLSTHTPQWSNRMDSIWNSTHFSSSQSVIAEATDTRREFWLVQEEKTSLKVVQCHLHQTEFGITWLKSPIPWKNTHIPDKANRQVLAQNADLRTWEFVSHRLYVLWKRASLLERERVESWLQGETPWSQGRCHFPKRTSHLLYIRENVNTIGWTAESALSLVMPVTLGQRNSIGSR